MVGCIEVYYFNCLTSISTEIPFTCHEGSPSLLLKTKAVIPTRVEVRYPEGSIEQVRQDARAAFDNFDRYGKLEDLEKAIANYKKDVEMTPKDDPEIHVALNNLALCIGARFEQLGRREDIDYSIALIRTSMKPNQYGAPIPIHSLSTLGNSLRRRYEQYGDPLDLEDSIVQQQKAVDVTPDGDARKPLLLCNLGSTFERRYERTGEPSDLNAAIVHGQLAIDLAPDSHPQKHLFLTNQGNSLQKRSERFGDLSDLDNGIVQQQLAVNLVPDGHPQRFMHLCNLGSALRVRSERLRNVADLDAAISYQRLGVSLIPKGHIEKPRYESGLGDSFFTRFEQLGNVSDINEAITRHRSAVSLAPEGHPSKLLYRNNLSICLMARFERLGNTIDIDDAIAEQQTALDLAPDNHPSKSMYFCNLGSSLATRFLRYRDISDLDNAIINHQKAVDLQSDTHYDNPTFLNNLAQSLRTRYRHLGDTRDAEDAIKHFSTSAMSSVGPAGIRFKAARGWILLAHSIHHTSLLEAYEKALELMPVVAWLGLPLSDRHRQLVEIGGMAREAAAAAISLEQYDKAIEWLEQGRSIVWTQLLQLRTPIDDLREVDPDLAKRLLEVSQLLDRGSGDMNVSGGGTAQDIEAEGRRYRGLTMEWESIIKKVRSLPNFETFLKPPSFSHLMKAAQNGPVVVLNIAEERCDALALVDGTDEVIHIPLPNITSKRVTELRDELMDMLYSDGIRERGEMRGRAAKFIEEPNDEEACKHILMELWTCVVKPVLDSLAFSVRLLISIQSSSTNVSLPGPSRHTFAYLVVRDWTPGISPNPCSRNIWPKPSER
jgi:tetratricopeptide (TPR) repeat protein